MSYIIGSFNVRSLRTCSPSQLAKIIIEEQYDILALQELKSPEALRSLLKYNLPDYYEGSNDEQMWEYGYIWNSKRFSECSKYGGPDIFSQYRSTNPLSRDPYYGRFTPCGLLGGAFFEIRLVNIHLHHGGNNSSDNLIKRIEEFKTVTSDIYDSISKKCYGNHMPAYTIVLGDYNLSCVICEQQRETSITYLVETEQTDKTTLSSTKDELVNDYDHISYSKKRFEGTEITIQRVDSVRKYANSDFDLHRKEISDHVPIKLELILNPRR